MKGFSIYILTFALAFSFFACGTKKTAQTSDSSPKIVAETPKALQENNLYADLSKVSSKRGNTDLMERMYRDLVEESPNLKKLEEDIIKLRTKEGELTTVFNTFDGKSIDYYAAANATTNALSDSVLKKKMLAVIAESSEKYAVKTKKINQLLTQFTDNNAHINDQLIVMKILLTMPIIQTFQDNQFPDIQGFQGLLKEQMGIIQRIDSLK